MVDKSDSREGEKAGERLERKGQGGKGSGGKIGPRNRRLEKGARKRNTGVQSGKG